MGIWLEFLPFFSAGFLSVFLVIKLICLFKALSRVARYLLNVYRKTNIRELSLNYVSLKLCFLLSFKLSPLVNLTSLSGHSNRLISERAKQFMPFLLNCSFRLLLRLTKNRVGIFLGDLISCFFNPFPLPFFFLV